ncbi:C25 family cysteine peptidase [Flavivirga spongiicola]|uniref:C25 family cysteine peptidase n=1 Tax=Flavivirga spongiicola TaxID=421621 RepID=A0ABU7XSB1_9FLAO|nr:C25 family cysteine peptidase [Flavivirga sp. MEBiC05379]MDO5978669.1 C25 family cysteine peptidase [Flavivirga sp. MEBiC05379]
MYKLRKSVGFKSLMLLTSIIIFTACNNPVKPESYKVLLITNNDLAEAWQAYADWKKSIGKSTKIITVSDISKDYNATNIQEKIRLCVRDYIENYGVKWVVLGGDSQPNDKGVVPGGHITVHQQEPKGIPTDIIYLSPTNWDADNDGIYGEFKDDQEAITYPDGSIGLGRIPVRTREDVIAFTEKVIAYEANYPTGSFASNMVYTCTDQPAYAKVRNSWDGYLSKVWNGNSKRFFSSETPWDEEGKLGSYELSAENLVSLINNKTTSKMHIHGHGHLPAWLLEGKSTFIGDHVQQLNNEGAYPLITTVSCNTGEYDSDKDPSIVEQMIRKPKGGSVAVVAPIRTGKPHFSDRNDFKLMVLEGKLDGTTHTMTRYWMAGMNDNATTGEALMKAKSEMIADAKNSEAYHLCICEINLLGDPTLDMRSAAPKTPKLEVEKQLTLGKNKLEVSTAISGCTVCVWKENDGIYEIAKADDTGKAAFNLEIASAGDMVVSASGINVNSAVTKIYVK